MIMNKNAIHIAKQGASTTLDIANMLHSYAKYLLDKDNDSKKKLIKYSILSAVGVSSLIIFCVQLFKED